MNRFTQIRQNIIDVLGAVPALVGIPVHAIVARTDIWGVFAQGTGIGVARTGANWDLRAHDLNYYVDQPTGVMFEIVIKTDCPVENASGLVDDGQAEDLEAAVLAAFANDIGIPGETGELHLIATTDRVMVHPNRAAGGAGPVALVLSCLVTPMWM